MRLWLKERERRPDPLPARTDARTAILAGTVAWLIAVVVLLVFYSELSANGFGWWLWCALIGVVLGVVGLAWVQFRRR